MTGPSEFDDGYYTDLGPQDSEDFEKLFRKKRREIDEDRARDSYEQTFESTYEAQYRLFRDVVNGFSSPQGGFEATLVNPLYEFSNSNIEILLTRPQVSSVHFCFVACEIGGQDQMKWINKINEIHDLIDEASILSSLKTHANCSGLDLGSVQYITITRDVDVPDLNFRVLKSGVNCEYYALWHLIRKAEYNESTESMEEAKTISYRDGKMCVPEFREACEQGVDPTAADNDDLKYEINAHPVFPIGKVCLELYLDKYGDEENPKEFYKSEFETVYFDNIHFGSNRDSMETIANDKIEELLEFGLDHGILKEDSSIVEERDYKIMWSSEDAGDIIPMVRKKFIDSKIPEEAGKLAYSRAKEDHEKGEYSLEDFTDTNK